MTAPASPTAGYVAKLSKGGSPTTMTAEACSALTDDAAGRKRYQITASAKRVIDPATAIVPKENGSASSAANIYSVDAMAGIITFASGHTPTTPVTVDAKYIPRAALTGVRKMSGALKVATVDSTTINQDGYVMRVPALLDFSGSFDVLDVPSGQSLDDVLTGRTPILFEQDLDGAGTKVVRAWVLVNSEGEPVDPAGLEVLTVAFDLADRSKAGTALSGFAVLAGVSVAAA